MGRVNEGGGGGGGLWTRVAEHDDIYMMIKGLEWVSRENLKYIKLRDND